VHELAIRLADASVRAGRGEDARGALEQALALDPSSRPVRDRLRALYESLGDRHALAQLELVEAAHVDDPVHRAGCLVRGGRLLLELGDAPEAALAAAQEASELLPGDQDVAMFLAEALARLGRRAEAAAVLERALAASKGRRSPKLALIHRTVARLALESADPPRALEAYGKAFDADPQNATLALELGALAVQLGELEIAGRAYRSVTLMRAAAPGAARASVPPPAAGRGPAPVEGANPQDKSLAYYQLGCIAYAQRDVRRARLMLEKALDEDPAFTAAREMLSGLAAT
jgi:tetratricopeptide (TPR) repeat protein